jgi:diguanylate cyclase (GGDEF)-like protein
MATTTKRAMLVLSHAMERAFETAGSDLPEDRGLVVALFQRREYFDVEAARYLALSQSGHTVIVGFTGSVDGVPEELHVVSLDDDEVRAREWVVLLVRGAYATSLVATDAAELSRGEMTIQASRVFRSRWRFDRNAVLVEVREYLGILADDLEPGVLSGAIECVERCEAEPASLIETRLADAAEHLVSSIELGERRVRQLRADLEESQLRAERDELTGLNNRHFLERFLGSGNQPADLLALLVDVDGLKAVNDTEGHLAGDVLLQTVASGLRENTRRGDVVVRWGGDEFLLLLSRVDDGTGRVIGEQLAQAIHAKQLPEPWGHLRPSVSIGACWTRRTSLPIDELDDALYRVKRSHKGHASLFSPLGQP